MGRWDLGFLLSLLDRWDLSDPLARLILPNPLARSARSDPQPLTLRLSARSDPLARKQLTRHR